MLTSNIAGVEHVNKETSFTTTSLTVHLKMLHRVPRKTLHQLHTHTHSAEDETKTKFQILFTSSSFALFLPPCLRKYKYFIIYYIYNYLFYIYIYDYLIYI